MALDIDDLLTRAIQQGLIDETAAAKLRALADADRAVTAPPVPQTPQTLEEETRRLRQQRREEEEAAREAAVRTLRAERDRAAAEESARRDRRAREKAAQIGARAALAGGGGSGGSGSGRAGGWVAIVGEAEAPGAGEDAGFRRDVLPLVYENVGWLVGTVLVLTGSVYGLREAWISFDAAGRWASVAGALLVYHALFVAVSAVLARRSLLAGQFLAGIGACMVPLAFVAVANLWSANAALGAAAAAALAAACVVTLAGVGRRFGVGGRALTPALLPAALTLLAYPRLATASPLRFLLPMAALAAGPWLDARRARTRGTLGGFVLALYAALASEIFALSSGAAGGVDADGWRVGGALYGTWLGAYVTVLGLALAAARAMKPATEAKRRALASVAWLGFALTIGAGGLAAVTSLTGDGALSTGAVAVALAAALVGCWQARVLAASRREGLYVLLTLAALAAATAARLALPAAGLRHFWALAALAPFVAHLAGARLVPAPPRRADAVAVGGALGATAFVLALEPARGGLCPFTLAAALAVAASCHAQQRRGGAPSWHYVGGAIAAAGAIAGLGGAADARVLGFAGVALAVLYGAAAVALAPRANAPAPAPAPAAEPEADAEASRVDAPASAPASALHDVSLGLLLGAAVAALRAVMGSGGPTPSWSGAAIAAAAPLVAAGVGLVLRGPLDRSALPPAAGALALAGAAMSIAAPPSTGAAARALGLLALAATAIAALLTGRDPREPSGTGRPPVLGRSVFFGAVELPWAWPGARAIAQGFGVAAAPLAAMTVLAGVAWLAATGGRGSALAARPDRALALVGALALAAACAVAFATRAGATFRLRGRPALLWALAVAAALAAITNRIGRPLPPAVVGRNLTVIGAGLWLLARGCARVGPWIEDELGAPAGAGARYPRVPLAGTIALAALLAIDALLLYPVPLFRGLSVVPPMMLLGPALLVVLLGRPLGQRATVALAAALVAAGAALAGAQGHVLGPELTPLRPPGGAWVPSAFAAGAPPLFGLGLRLGRFDVLDPARYGGAGVLPALYRGALAGLAAAALAFAALAAGAARVPRIGARLRALAWSTPASTSTSTSTVTVPGAGALAATLARAAAAAVLIVCAAGLAVTSVPAAFAAAVAAALAAGARRPAPTPRAALPLVAALALVVHALAQAPATIAAWPGVALAALALAAAIGGAADALGARADRARAPERAADLAAAHALAAAALLFALGYAFAAGGATSDLAAGAAVLRDDLDGLAGWGTTPVPAIAFALGAAAAFVAAASWSALVRRAETAAAAVTGALLAAEAVALGAVWRSGVGERAEQLVLVAASAAAVAGALHVAALAARAERWTDLRRGLAIARDLLVVGAGALVALALLVVRAPAHAFTAPLALATIAAALAVALHALVRERRPRHVYLAGALLVGGYGLLRATGIVGAQPAADAIVLLALDFALVGVTVLTRRAGLELNAIATATRRFAAALPIAVALVLPWQATLETAMLTVATAGFYGLLGWVERSRLLGTFGAVAANLALLALSLSQGLRGFDVYLVPLGLCTIAIVHLFADGMAAETRVALRFVGTGLTYAPAALTLVLQVGNARSDLYPLGFAAACLVGIGAGMWFHIRAYLVLGGAFLLLDLGTGLVRASLRNQRLGFFVLSAAGLAILSVMIAYTMNKESVRAGLRRLQRALGTWG